MRDAVANGSFQPSDFTRLANETGLVPDILTQLALVGADGRFVASNLDPDGQKNRPRGSFGARAHPDPPRAWAQPRPAQTAHAQWPVCRQTRAGQSLGQVDTPAVTPDRFSKGHLHGVVVASVNPDYFETVFSDVDWAPAEL